MADAVWQPQAAATLLMPSGPEGDHLFVVLCDPKTFPGYGPNPCVLLVNVSSIREGSHHDPTCVLEPGSHPFVKRVSFVAYRYARVEFVPHVMRLVEQGLFKPHDPMPPEILARILDGLRRSPFTKREFKQLPI
jgi:hypothetical protein